MLADPLHRCRGAGQRGYSLSRKRISPLEPQEKGVRLAVSILNDLGASGMEIPARGVAAFSSSIRFGLLLFSLSLCLRFVTLTQFPSTTDFHCFVFVCRDGLAGTRCNMEADGRRKLVRTSTSWAERHPQGVYRIRKAAEPPTVAQQRIIEVGQIV